MGSSPPELALEISAGCGRDPFRAHPGRRPCRISFDRSYFRCAGLVLVVTACPDVATGSGLMPGLIGPGSAGSGVGSAAVGSAAGGGLVHGLVGTGSSGSALGSAAVGSAMTGSALLTCLLLLPSAPLPELPLRFPPPLMPPLTLPPPVAPPVVNAPTPDTRPRTPEGNARTAPRAPAQSRTSRTPQPLEHRHPHDTFGRRRSSEPRSRECPPRTPIATASRRSIAVAAHAQPLRQSGRSGHKPRRVGENLPLAFEL